MYEAFYALKIKPFQLNPDPHFYFGSKPHRRASAYLDYGVSRNEGFIVITGDIGAGKTTVLAQLLNKLDRGSVVVGQIVTTQLDAEDTLRMVGAAFGVPVKDVPKAELLITLEAFLVTQASRGKRCLLVVDEAQNLTPRAVEELRMLSNYQLGTQSLLQTFLIGQPEFRLILQRPEMEQFRQRITASCHLGPLDVEDTRGYVEHRVARAGGDASKIFGAEAYEAIHGATGGVPRRINMLCDRLLLLGFLEDRKPLTAADVDKVAADLVEETAGRQVVERALAANSGFGVLSAAATPAVAARATPAAPPMAGGDAEALQRVERGLQRLERVQMQTLALMRELIAEIRHAERHDDGGKRE